jgi:dynein heavy chain
LSLLSPERRYFIQQEQQRLEEADSTSLVSLIESAQEREAYFNARLVERVHTNLRVAVSATAHTPALTHIVTECRSFADACSVDCYDSFSTEALAAIARAHFAHDEKLQRFVEFASVENGALARACAALHVGALSQQATVSVASYQEMLRALGALLHDRGGEVWSTLQRLTVGAAKLRSTARLVGEMQRDLEALLGRRDSTEEEMERLIASIAREQEALDASRAQLQIEQEEAERESTAAAQAAVDAQQDVDSVVPLVSQAIKELSSLNKKDIAEIKSLTKPPPRLMIVLEALCIILGRAPKRTRVQQPGKPGLETVEAYWPVARELLAQVNFVQTLLSFDKDEMDEKTVQKLRPYIENPTFQPGHVGRISVACKSICIWVRAMYSYHVAKVTKMEPRVERLREVRSDLEAARGALAARRRELGEMEEKISHLKSRYENARGAKNGLVKQAEESEIKVQRATRLIGRLEGECARWEKCAEELRGAWTGVVGDALLAAGHVAYLGRVPRKLRESQVRAWQAALREIRLPFSEGFSFLRFCAEQHTVQEWVAAGLPNDRQSLENAVMVRYAQRWVKVADPQSQASAWIRRRENGAVVLEEDSVDLEERVEKALQKGRGVVVSVEKGVEAGLLHSVLRSNRACGEKDGGRTVWLVHVRNEEAAAVCLKEVRSACEQRPRLVELKCSTRAVVEWLEQRMRH